MAVESSEVATASAGAGLQPVHAFRACPDRAQSRTGGLQTHDDPRPGRRDWRWQGNLAEGLRLCTIMAAEDETPRGALTCLHTRGASSFGRGATGLRDSAQGWTVNQKGRAMRRRGRANTGDEVGGKASRRHNKSLLQHNSANRRQEGACPRIEGPYVNQARRRGL